MAIRDLLYLMAGMNERREEGMKGKMGARFGIESVHGTRDVN